MGVGDGGNRVGVAVEVGKRVEVGWLVAREGCVAMRVGEGLAAGKPCSPHAVQRTRMISKTRDFILLPVQSMLKRLPTSQTLYVIQVFQRLDDFLSKIICEVPVITQARDQAKGPVTAFVFRIEIDDRGI